MLIHKVIPNEEMFKNELQGREFVRATVGHFDKLASLWRERSDIPVNLLLKATFASKCYFLKLGEEIKAIGVYDLQYPANFEVLCVGNGTESDVEALFDGMMIPLDSNGYRYVFSEISPYKQTKESENDNEE